MARLTSEIHLYPAVQLRAKYPRDHRSHSMTDSTCRYPSIRRKGTTATVSVWTEKFVSRTITLTCHIRRTSEFLNLRNVFRFPLTTFKYLVTQHQPLVCYHF